MLKLNTSHFAMAAVIVIFAALGSLINFGKPDYHAFLAAVVFTKDNKSIDAFENLYLGQKKVIFSLKKTDGSDQYHMALQDTKSKVCEAAPTYNLSCVEGTLIVPVDYSRIMINMTLKAQYLQKAQEALANKDIALYESIMVKKNKIKI